jgi:hypothetical protein
MATAVRPLATTRTNAAPTAPATAALPTSPLDPADDQDARPPMPDPRADSALAALLRSTHPTYRAGVADWLTAERRLFGGAPALSELQPFAKESAADYAIRQRKATYAAFPHVLASTTTGHIVRHMPTPNYGTLGDVRPIDARTGPPTLAELIDYNCDGVGNDGTQWKAWWARITMEIHGPGLGWIYVEAPPGGSGTAITAADMRAGRRPYLVHFPPGQVPNHHVVDGRREWAIVRPELRRPRLDGGTFAGNDAAYGYLLLVRRGWDGFGDTFRRGGWWLFDADLAPVSTGDWARTKGEIPLFPYVYEASHGVRAPAGGDGVVLDRARSATATVSSIAVDEFGAVRDGATGDAVHRPVTSYPALARSGTLELGNVAVALMDAISERDYDARTGAKSGLTVMGVDPRGGLDENQNPIPNNFNDYVYSKDAQSVINPIPYSLADVGTNAAGQPMKQVVVPNIQDDATGVLPAEVYAKIVESKFVEAREIMARELTSAPDSSGASKAAGFAEGKSPRLALLSANLETAQNTALYFLELRAGATMPRGYVTLPRDYDLAPVLDTIDRALERLRIAQLDSPTLVVDLTMRSLDEDNLLPDDPAERAAVRAELTASASTPRATALETLLGASRADGGGPPVEPAPESRESPDPVAPPPRAPRRFVVDKGDGNPPTTITEEIDA